MVFFQEKSSPRRLSPQPRSLPTRSWLPGEDLLRVITDKAGLAIWVLDGDGEILFGGPSLEEAWGVSLAAIHERSGCWIEQVHPEDRGRLLDFARAVRGGADDVEVEYRLPDVDGRLRWLQTRVFRAHDELEGLVTVGVTRDVTAARAGALAAHDLRDLTMVIRWATRLLLDRKAEDDPDVYEIRLVESAAERARGLTRGLMARSPWQAARPEELDLNALIEGMEPVLRGIAGEVDFFCLLDPALRRVRVDRAQMEQAILNLVTNAREAVYGGGRIEIVTRNFGRAFQDAGSAMPPLVEVAVRDDGVGMDPVVRERVFEPFFTTKKKGAGLGLPMVYEAVRQGGGCVHVASAPGAGTTVTIHLPAVGGVPGEPQVVAVSSSEVQ